MSCRPICPWPLGSLATVARPQRADVQDSPLHENVYVDNCKEDGARRYQERTLLSSGCSLLPSIRICVDNPARWASSFEVPEDTVLTSLSPVQRREQTELGRGSNRGGTRQHAYQQRVSDQTVRLRATNDFVTSPEPLNIGSEEESSTESRELAIQQTPIEWFPYPMHTSEHYKLTTKYRLID